MRRVWPRDGDFSLLTISGDDKIRILLHNARQILEIVKATFPGATFDDQTYAGDCVQSNSDVEVLPCQWRNITRMLEQGGSENTDMILDAILEVGSFNVPSSEASLNQSSSREMLKES